MSSNLAFAPNDDVVQCPLSLKAAKHPLYSRTQTIQSLKLRLLLQLCQELFKGGYPS